MAGVLTVLLCGDVMTGRGVHQILPHPGDPTLRESYLPDARRYVELAEVLSGPIRDRSTSLGPGERRLVPRRIWLPTSA